MKRFGWISLVVAIVTTAPGGLLAQSDAPDAASTAAAESLELPGRFSSTVAFTNDYAFRGVSQSDEDVAIQASIDWSHPDGVYAGFWSSNVDFAEPTAQIELDVYGGYTGDFSGVTYDVLDVVGDAVLAGELNVDLSFTPQIGQQFTIIHASSVSGAFDAVTGAGAYDVTYNPDSVVLTFLGFCTGDADGDNDVDLSDLATVLGQFGQSGVGLAGDVDADQDVDLTDLAIVLANFGVNCG